MFVHQKIYKYPRKFIYFQKIFKNYDFRYRKSFFALAFMTYSKFGVDDIKQYHG